MPDIVDPGHMQMARELRRLYSLYQQNRDLISVGAYQPGSDHRIDKAIEKNPGILEFLQQDMDEPVDMTRSLQELALLLGVNRTAAG
jgi:flagellum-specific ATP synthase